MLTALVAVSAITIAPTLAQAQVAPPPINRDVPMVFPEHTTAYYTMDLKLRNQPLGVLLANRFFIREQLFKDMRVRNRENIVTALLFEPDAYIQFGVGLNISPAYIDVGPEVEFSPLRLLVLKAGFYATNYFGLLDYMLGFDTNNPATDDDGIDAYVNSGVEEQSGWQRRIEGSATFQLAKDRLAVRNIFTVQYNWFNNFDGDFVREPFYDRLQETDRNGDSILVNLAVLMWDFADLELPRQVLVGPFHEWVRGLNTDDADDNRHRVGLMGVWLPRGQAGHMGKLYKPRLLVQVGYNVVDRSNGRDGHIFAQGLLGFDLHLNGPDD